MKILTLLAASLFVCTGVAAQSATRENLVVTSDWLAAHLADTDIVVLQVGEKTTYDRAHAPGARYVNVSADLSLPNPEGKGLSLEMLPADALRDRLAGLGISDASHVIVVQSDDWWSPATRLVFTLDYAGLKRVSWLDGGLGAWTSAGRPTTADVPGGVRGTLSPLAIRPLVVDAAFVATRATQAGYALVDARAVAFYDGSQPGGRRGGPQKSGHIPGARSAPFSEFATADARLKAPREIEAVFDKAGVKPQDTVIAYCHIGQQATAVLFAARTLGHPVLLYDGSFEDWVLRDLPVDNPAAKAAGGK
jgi:thiosulfate/3-mercaptopyruvate sulfurtransferase